MSEVFVNKSDPKNILLVAITRMGDMLQASPTIVGLKKQYPNARLTVAIDRTFAAICDGIPGIDEVYALDLSFMVRAMAREGEGIVEAYKYFDTMVKDLKGKNFDYVLNMSSSPYTALLLKILNIEDSRGWMADEEGHRLITSPWAVLFAAFIFHANRDYNGINLVDIFRCAAGVKEHPHTLRYVPKREEMIWANEFLLSSFPKGGGPVLYIQAGASQEKRQWEPKKFASLVRILVERFNARVVFVGANSERHIVEAIEAQYQHQNVVSALGMTTFGQLAALFACGDLLVTGDTGPMHLSVAVGKPVVAVFLASALCYETGPYGPGNIVVQPQITCNPCNPNYPCSRPDCHDQISPELVAELVQMRLSCPMERDSEMELPTTLKGVTDAAIYITEFDTDGFLAFRRLGGGTERRGASIDFFESARESYKALWKEEFEGIISPIRANVKNAMEHPSLHGLSDAVKLAQEGIHSLTKLQQLIRDPQGSPNQLRDLNNNLQMIDQRIEEVGLASPPLGGLVRVFLMEKENVRGKDVTELSNKSAELYRTLIRRSLRFGELFSELGPKSDPLRVLPS